MATSMADPCIPLTIEQTKGSVRANIGKKKFKGKNVLLDPYRHTRISDVTSVQEQEILEKIKREFMHLNLAKEHKRPPWKRTKKAKTDVSTNLADDNAQNKDEPDNESVRRKIIMKEIYLGINRVTKGLERDELRLVLLCAHVQPSCINNHVLELAARKKCHACRVASLSSTVSEALNISSASAIGFKKVDPTEESMLNELVSFITERTTIPPLLGENLEETNSATESESQLETLRTAEPVSSEADKDLESKAGNSTSSNFPGYSSIDFSKFYIYRTANEHRQINSLNIMVDFGSSFVPFSASNEDSDFSDPEVVLYRQHRSQNESVCVEMSEEEKPMSKQALETFYIADIKSCPGKPNKVKKVKRLKSGKFVKKKRNKNNL